MVNPHLRDRTGDSARWVLQQIVQLADQMPELTDVELRDRLLTLAGVGPAQEVDRGRPG
ncbi:MAG: hypothetical protein ACRDTH_29270 [Pseudonocardiaceae bacterium]